MRLMTLLLGSALLFGCVGTRVVEVDPSIETDIHHLLEAAEAQAGEVVGQGVKFTKGKLDWTGGVLIIAPSDGSPLNTINLQPVERPFDIRLRYAGSPLGALIGVVAGAGIGYLASYRGSSGASTSIGRGLARIGFASGGGLLGAFLGAVLGPKKTTIYRFRPTTPQQMSVVIGVGATKGGTR